MNTNLLKKRGIKVETIFRTIKAKAETEGEGTEPKQEGTEPTPQPPVNFEELIAKARKEEKDKLYPQIDGYKKQVADMTTLHNNTLLEMASKDKMIEDLQKQIKELSETKATPEDVNQLANQIQTLQLENQALKEAQVDVEALTQSINSEWEVKLYREQKLREVGNVVIPELVSGNTKEEIDNSIELSKQRYAEIVQGARGGQPYVPASNVSTKSYSIKDVNPLDIRNMSAEEWAEKRKSLGLK